VVGFPASTVGSARSMEGARVLTYSLIIATPAGSPRIRPGSAPPRDEARGTRRERKMEPSRPRCNSLRALPASRPPGGLPRSARCLVIQVAPTWSANFSLSARSGSCGMVSPGVSRTAVAGRCSRRASVAQLDPEPRSKRATSSSTSGSLYPAAATCAAASCTKRSAAATAFVACSSVNAMKGKPPGSPFGYRVGM